MQQILNTHDRNQAFFKFLAFFLATIILIVVAVYFNFVVDKKENQWLQSQLTLQHVQEASEVDFVNKMDRAVALFDSLNKDPANPLIASSLQDLIGEMNNSGVSRNTLYGKLNYSIVTRFTELRGKILELHVKENEFSDYKKTTEAEMKVKDAAINALQSNHNSPVN